MSAEEKILTLYPHGKSGVNISFRKYEQVKRVVEMVLQSNPNLTFTQMAEIAKEVLINEQFDGKPLWYITSVKLDLEARGRIKRIPKTSPQQLQLVG